MGKERKMFLVHKKYDWSSERLPIYASVDCTRAFISCSLSWKSLSYMLNQGAVNLGTLSDKMGTFGILWVALVSASFTRDSNLFFMWAGFLTSCHQSEIQSAEVLTLLWTVARDFIISLWLRELCSIWFFSHIPLCWINWWIVPWRALSSSHCYFSFDSFG